MKHFFSLGVLLLLSSFCFAQQVPSKDINDSSEELVFAFKETTALEDAQFLLHRQTFYGYQSYETYGGEKLSFYKVNELVKSVPGNASLTKKSMIWHIVSLVGIGGTIGAFAWGAASQSDTQRALAVPAGIALFSFSFVSSTIRESYQARAVDNYNLFLLGLER